MNYRDAVRKLMDKARNATEQGRAEEAQNYAEKAAALATKHSVEDALNEVFDSKPVKLILKKVTFGAPYPKHRINLLARIGKHQSCKVVKVGRNGAEVFGDERDVERTMFIYRLISAHMLAGAADAHPKLSTAQIHGGLDAKHDYFKKAGFTPAEVKSFRVSWVIGYISGIDARMTEAYKTAVDTAKTSQGKPGAALVLADRRAMVDRFVTETCGKLGKSTRSRVNHAEGFYAGKAASNTADLGQTRLNARLEITA